MISLQSLKYKILEYCLEILFDKFTYNFSYLSYNKLKRLPTIGETFSVMFDSEYPNRIYKICKCVDSYEGDPSIQQTHISVMVGCLYIDGSAYMKYSDVPPVKDREFYLGSDSFRKWRYLK